MFLKTLFLRLEDMLSAKILIWVAVVLWGVYNIALLCDISAMYSSTYQNTQRLKRDGTRKEVESYSVEDGMWVVKLKSDDKGANEEIRMDVGEVKFYLGDKVYYSEDNILKGIGKSEYLNLVFGNPMGVIGLFGEALLAFVFVMGYIKKLCESRNIKILGVCVIADFLLTLVIVINGLVVF